MFGHCSVELPLQALIDAPARPQQNLRPGRLVRGGYVRALRGEQQHRIQASKIFDVFLVVSVVGGDDIPWLGGDLLQVAVPLLPARLLVAADLVAGRGDNDEGLVEGHEKLTHRRGMGAEQCVGAEKLFVGAVGVVKLSTQRVGTRLQLDAVVLRYDLEVPFARVGQEAVPAQ